MDGPKNFVSNRMNDVAALRWSRWECSQQERLYTIAFHVFQLWSSQPTRLHLRGEAYERQDILFSIVMNLSSSLAIKFVCQHRM